MKINWTKLYWPIIAVPVLLIGLGSFSNQAVLIANHGKFPVMVNEAQQEKHQSDSREIDIGDLHLLIPSVARESQFLGDDTHSVMGPNSHLKPFADIFNIGEGVASIGDFLIMAGVWFWKFAPTVWLTLVIRKLWSCS